MRHQDIFLLSLSLFFAFYNVPPAFAAKPTPMRMEQQVFGNPVGTRDNFTINSTKQRGINVECLFINSSEKPSRIALQLTPQDITPTEVIELNPGTKTKPFQALKKLHFKLDKHWWCRVYAPTQSKGKWSYCAYFAIADSDHKEQNPFTTLNLPTTSKDVSYHCRLIKPKQNVSFFYYKNPYHGATWLPEKKEELKQSKK